MHGTHTDPEISFPAYISCTECCSDWLALEDIMSAGLGTIMQVQSVRYMAHRWMLRIGSSMDFVERLKQVFLDDGIPHSSLFTSNKPKIKQKNNHLVK